MLFVASGQIPSSCQIGDVRTTDEYLCALNGTSIPNPWIAAFAVFAIWLAVVWGVAAGIRSSRIKK